MSIPSLPQRILLAGALALAMHSAVSAQTAGAYVVTNLVSDGSVPAVTTDPNFINPWAISVSGTWWISTQATGFNYAISSTTDAISFKVIVPASSGLTTATGSPAGSASTSGATGMLLPNGTKASFLFSTLDGTISGWNSKLGTANAISQIAVNNTAAGAIYPDLAILNLTAGSYILVPNFGTGNTVEVYDSTFKPASLGSAFVDPTLPANYAPYSVHVLGTQIFVAYALRSTTTPYHPVVGAGNGIVSVFDTTGKFVSRAVTGGNLNAPWGVAIAPSTFGIYANDLLIGNFGDGIVNVYNPTTFAYQGQLMDGTGKTLVYPSLWELQAGGTPAGGVAGNVYFTAGLTNEAHGLLAGISNSTASGTPAFGLSSSPSTLTVTDGSSVQTTVSIAPTFNFAGNVTLACSNLPLGAVCSFGPAALPVLGTAPSTELVTIQTTKASAALAHPASLKGIAFALLVPFAGLFGFRRRGGRVRILSLGLVLLAAASLAGGCGDTGAAAVLATPKGAQTFNIVATSGTQTQTITMTLNVQ